MESFPDHLHFIFTEWFMAMRKVGRSGVCRFQVCPNSFWACFRAMRRSKLRICATSANPLLKRNQKWKTGGWLTLESLAFIQEPADAPLYSQWWRRDDLWPRNYGGRRVDRLISGFLWLWCGQVALTLASETWRRFIRSGRNVDAHNGFEDLEHEKCKSSGFLASLLALKVLFGPLSCFTPFFFHPGNEKECQTQKLTIEKIAVYPDLPFVDNGKMQHADPE